MLKKKPAYTVAILGATGAVGIEMTTILDLTGPRPVLVRQGRGEVGHVVELE